MWLHKLKIRGQNLFSGPFLGAYYTYTCNNCLTSFGHLNARGISLFFVTRRNESLLMSNRSWCHSYMQATHSGALQVQQRHFVACLSPFRFQQFLQFVRSPSKEPGCNVGHSVPVSGRTRLRCPVDIRLSSAGKCSSLILSVRLKLSHVLIFSRNL